MQYRKLEHFIDQVPNGEYLKSDREEKAGSSKYKRLPVVLQVGFYTKLCLYFVRRRDFESLLQLVKRLPNERV